jgi:hypothetical protein
MDLQNRSAATARKRPESPNHEFVSHFLLGRLVDQRPHTHGRRHLDRREEEHRQ